MRSGVIASLWIAVSGCYNLGEFDRCTQDPSGTDCFVCPGNLIPDPGFENGTAGFDPWNSTIEHGPVGRSGNGLHVCEQSGGTTDYSAHWGINGARAGTHYRASAFVKVSVSSPQDIALVFTEDTSQEGGSSPFQADDMNWTSLTMDADYTLKAVTPMNFAFLVRAKSTSDTACFDLDDVCLRTTE